MVIHIRVYHDGTTETFTQFGILTGLLEIRCTAVGTLAAVAHEDRRTEEAYPQMSVQVNHAGSMIHVVVVITQGFRWEE